MKKYKSILIIISIYLLDLITKLIVTSNIKLHGSKEVIKNFFYITYTKNKGAAFSILENKIYIILIVTVFILAYLVKELLKKDNKKIYDISLSLILGGLLSNLSDRLFLGYVRDFIDFRFGSYNFAIFNVGDIFIVCGCIIYLISILMEEKHEQNSKRK